jgi:hypothetical protein
VQLRDTSRCKVSELILHANVGIFLDENASITDGSHWINDVRRGSIQPIQGGAMTLLHADLT